MWNVLTKPHVIIYLTGHIQISCAYPQIVVRTSDCKIINYYIVLLLLQ